MTSIFGDHRRTNLNAVASQQLPPSSKNVKSKIWTSEGGLASLSALRLIKTKPEAVRPKFNLYIRYTFHKNARTVSPRNVSYIEHLLRQGSKQIEQFEDPGVKDCFVSKEMSDWVIQRVCVRKTFMNK